MAVTCPKRISMSMISPVPHPTSNISSSSRGDVVTYVSIIDRRICLRPWNHQCCGSSSAYSWCREVSTSLLEAVRLTEDVEGPVLRLVIDACDVLAEDPGHGELSTPEEKDDRDDRRPASWNVPDEQPEADGDQ